MRLSVPLWFKMNSDVLKSAFDKSVSAVNPRFLIKNLIKVRENKLIVDGKNIYNIRPNSVNIVGFGKAVCSMANALTEQSDIFGESNASFLKTGICNIPTGYFDKFPSEKRDVNSHSKNSVITFIEGAENNLPDLNAMKGAEMIKQLCINLKEDDLLIVLISGGGSALLPLPKQEITLQEKLEIVKKLGKAGADIKELNCVRKRISELKGGMLAKFAYPARVVTFILSDVIGDPLDFIASGPTVKNNDHFKAPQEILKKYNLWQNCPESIKIILSNKNDEEEKVGEVIWKGVDNYILGNNQMAAEAAVKELKTKLKFPACILSTKIQGDVSEISDAYFDLTKIVLEIINNENERKNKEKLQVFITGKNREKLGISDCNFKQIMAMDFSSQGVCFVAGGEPTVRVKGNGKGGRNQQLVLDFLFKLHESNLLNSNKNVDVWFLSCGTDGIDGPTDAAGAYGNSTLIQEALNENLDPKKYLQNNDTYNFFEKFKKSANLIKTGHTGTNVMDIHLLCFTFQNKNKKSCNSQK